MDAYERELCEIIHKPCVECIKKCLNYTSSIIPNEESADTRFYSIKDGMNYFIKLAFPIISIIGCLGNIAIIFIVLRLPWLRKSYTNFFLVNMALADLCVLIWCVNLTAIEYVDPEVLWIVGPILCKLNHFFQILSYTSSILLLMLMCLERYIAIIFPMKVKEMLSKRIYIILLIFIWLISGCFSLPGILNYELQKNDNITQCTSIGKINTKYYHICTFILLYVVPLLLMATLYGHMSYNLWKSMKPIIKYTSSILRKSNTSTAITIEDRKQEINVVDNNQNFLNPNNNPKKTFKSKQVVERRRVILMLIVIVIVFAVCRLARHVWSFLIHTKVHNNIVLLIFPPFAYMFMYLSSAINPFIYFAFSTSARKNFLKAICCHSTMTFTKGHHLHMTYSKGCKSTAGSL